MTILDYLKQNIQKTEFSQFTIIDEITHQNFSFIFFFGDGDGDNSDGYFDFLNLILKELEIVDVNDNNCIVSNVSSFILNNFNFLRNFILKYLVIVNDSDSDSDSIDLFLYSSKMIKDAFAREAFTRKFYITFSEDFLKYKEKCKKSETSLLLSAVNAIGCLLNEDVDSQAKAKDCVGEIAEHFFIKGKDELGEYCLAQCNMCPTFTTFEEAD